MSRKPKVNLGIAYLLWALGFMGVCGVHRFYLGQPITGIVWLCTGGLFFFGQFIDLFLIPSMVKERARLDWKNPYNRIPQSWQEVQQQLVKELSISLPQLVKPQIPQDNHDSMHRLLEVAKANHNILSFGQAVLATKLPPETIEQLLNRAMQQGIVEIENDPETGRVRYHFDL